MTYKLFNNKKAASVDNFYVAISFFSFALAMLISLMFWNTISSGEIDTKLMSATATGTQIKANGSAFFDHMDGFIVMVYVLFHLAMLLVAYMLRTHPIMYVIGIFLILILVYITVPLTDAWNTLISDSTFSTTADTLKLTNYIMNNFTTLEMIWGFITIIILAGMARSEGIV